MTAFVNVLPSPLQPTTTKTSISNSRLQPNKQPVTSNRLAKLQHRVLIYITCYNVLDGVTLTIRKIEQEILAAGHSVCILTTNSGNMENTDLDGTHRNRQIIFIDNAIPIPFIHDADKPELTYCIGFALSPHVQQQMNAYEPSIIHLCATDSTSLHIIQYARQKEIPIMGTYHSNIPDYLDHYGSLSCLKHILRSFFRHQYNFLQALFVPTPYIQQNLIRDSMIDQVTSIQIWGRGVDIDKFNPAHRSIEYRNHILSGNGTTGSHYNIDTPILLWVGRLVCEKRFDIFMNIVKRLSAKQCKFHALVVGAGTYEEEIKTLPNTTFAGWLTIDQLSIVYASCDVFLFPSAVETFGNVTLEAAASGLPVIVEAGCSGHLVHNEGNGYICPANDEVAFYEATLTLIEDKQLREEFGTCGREMSLSMEKSAVVRQMIDNYSRITDQFYTEYAGHHSNRDVEYTQTGSFLLGTYPRSMILIMAETLFIFLFDMVWKLTSIMTSYNKSICVGTNKNKSKSHTEVHTESTLTTPLVKNNSTTKTTSPTKVTTAAMLSSLKLNQNQKDRQDIIDSTSRKGITTNGTITKHQPLIELNDVEIGGRRNVHTTSVGEPVLIMSSSGNNNNGNNNTDDHTSSTCNSSQTSMSTTVTTTPIKQPTDVGMSHTLVKAIVTTVQFICRIESRIRVYISSLFNNNKNRNKSSMVRRSQNEFIGAAKRKNSSVTTAVSTFSNHNDLGDTSHDTFVQHRGRGGRNEMIVVCDMHDDTTNNNMAMDDSSSSLYDNHRHDHHMRIHSQQIRLTG